MPLSQVEDYTDTRLAEKISQLPGVGAVTISGGQKPAVRVQVNPTQLSSYGLNLEDVRSALTAASLDTAKGQLRRDHRKATRSAPTIRSPPARTIASWC